MMIHRRRRRVAVGKQYTSPHREEWELNKLRELIHTMGLDNPIHIAFLLILLLLVFGAKRLPEMGKSLGSGMRGFKDSLSGEGMQSALTAQPPAPTQTVAAAPVAAPVATPVAAAPVATAVTTPVAAPAPAPAEQVLVSVGEPATPAA
jgi:sec-independent protein translocase protein TatA